MGLRGPARSALRQIRAAEDVDFRPEGAKKRTVSLLATIPTSFNTVLSNVLGQGEVMTLNDMQFVPSIAPSATCTPREINDEPRRSR
jgi:hypothetical protein